MPETPFSTDRKSHFNATVRRMALISVNGRQVNIEDTGAPAGNPDAPVVVLGHGLLFSTTMWREQVAVLRSSYRCVTVDWRGQGATPPAADGYDMDSLYDDLVGVIEHLDVGPVHYLGLSMGGFVGQRLAARRPDLVRSVAAHEPPLLGAAAADTALGEMVRGVRSWVLDIASLLDGPHDGPIARGQHDGPDDPASGHRRRFFDCRPHLPDDLVDVLAADAALARFVRLAPMTQATALGGKLDRSTLVGALSKTDNWTANDMHSPQHVGTKRTGDCWRFIQLSGGAWKPVGGSKYMCAGTTQG